MDLLAYATRHLTPLGITVEQAQKRAQATPEDPAYSTPRALDVLRRMHAANLRMVVPTASYAPILPPTLPTTIAALDEDTLVVRHGGQESAVAPVDLIPHLTGRGILAAHPEHRSLIVDTPQTLRILTSLLSSTRDHQAATWLDWWLQRADHTGTGATFVATQDARKRWVTGEHPDTERDLQTWRRWLDLPEASPAQMCESIVRLAADGATLTGLLECHSADSYSWDRLNRHPRRNRPGVDTRRDAAIGLTSRNQAAEYYASIRLSDPIVAQVALREGHLLQATVQPGSDSSTLHLLSQSPVSRFRVNAAVQAWAGTVANAGSPTRVRSGTVTSIAVTSGGDLSITIEDTMQLTPLSVGDPITVRPRLIDHFQQNRLRSQYYGRLRDQRNWVARTATPPTTRRAVPLDVVIAASPEQDLALD